MRSSFRLQNETIRLCVPVFVCVLGTREAAFVYAISAASVAFAVTRACSSGELEKCGCDHNVHGVSPEGRSLFSLSHTHTHTHTKTQRKQKDQLIQYIWMQCNLKVNNARFKIFILFKKKGQTDVISSILIMPSYLHVLIGFQWSGCSDNIAYGVAFSQSFVDVRERSKGQSSSRALMNLHNNEAGRKVTYMHFTYIHFF